jgi:hypothetical protein
VTGTLELDHVDFDVRDGLREAVDAFRVVAASKGLELVCDIGSGVPPMVVGDPARLRQGLVNLLGMPSKVIILHGQEARGECAGVATSREREVLCAVRWMEHEVALWHNYRRCNGREAAMKEAGNDLCCAL